MNIEARLRKVGRAGSLVVAGGFRPPADPTTTWLGTVLVGRDGEGWPSGSAGPMLPVAQLNLTEAPVVPTNLRDLALLALFVDQSLLDDPDVESPCAPGEAWAVRSYPSLDGLVPLPQPPSAAPWRAFAARYEGFTTDLPSWEDLYDVDPDLFNAVDESGDDWIDVTLGVAVDPERPPHKLGGFPTPWQGESPVPCTTEAPGAGDGPMYVLQIGSDPKLEMNWWDGGELMLARGGADDADQWLLGWDFA